MPATVKEQGPSWSKSCDMKKGFCVLLVTVVLATMVISQILYHKNEMFGDKSVKHFNRLSAKLFSSDDADKKTRPLKQQSKNQKCPDVLRLMTDGKWVPRRTSKKETDYVEKFLEFARGHPIFREDGRCGNTSMPGRVTVRALCDPKGDKPCCRVNTCKAVPVEQCRCKGCYDVRQRIHAEYAAWRPKDPRCKLKNFTATEACNLLSGSTVYLIGDSLIRQLYQAFLMVVKNDGRFGALNPKLPEKGKRMCEGMYSFSTGVCRPAWDARPGMLCDGTFRLQFVSQSKSKYAKELLHLTKGVLHKEKTLLMPGLGLHENCSDTKMKKYLKDSIALLKSKKARWPKLIWATAHAPGLSKAPVFTRQEFHFVEEFNRKMRNYLEPLGIPVFDTFNLTKDAVSIDGTHFGIGVNIVKVQLFLNYLQELRNNHKW